MEDEWYYFTKRTQVSKEKIGCGYNVKRRITGENNDGIDRGCWKVTDNKENIIDEDTGNIIGFKQSLTFISSNDTHKKKKQKIENSVSTGFVQGSEDSWIMKEFTLPDQNEFQELVICKITRKKVSKNKVTQAISTTSCYVAEKEISIHHNGEEEDMVNQIDIILSTNLENNFEMTHILRIPRLIDVPDEGILCDLIWADPDREIEGWRENDRGVSYTFGADKVAEFLQTHDLDLICRAHQVVEDGYEFFAKRQLGTIFSAPNYCGEFHNAGAMMSVDDSLTCLFQILKASEKKGKFGINNNVRRPGTPPHKGGKGG